MTEQQNPSPDHRAPLAPGEIRIHWIGDTSYQVMHVAGGSFTQASVREYGQPSRVLCTDTDARIALEAYAAAIEQAEAAEQRAEPDLTFNTPGGASMTLVTGERPILEERLNLDRAIAETRRFEEIDREAVARGESANWWERTGERPTDPYAEREASAAYNINVLRGLLHGTALPEDVRAAGLDALGKLKKWIAAKAPVPTRVWMHRCGVVLINDTEPPPCHVCVSTPQIRFQRLYTIGEMR